MPLLTYLVGNDSCNVQVSNHADKAVYSRCVGTKSWIYAKSSSIYCVRSAVVYASTLGPIFNWFEGFARVLAVSWSDVSKVILPTVPLPFEADVTRIAQRVATFCANRFVPSGT